MEHVNLSELLSRVRGYFLDKVLTGGCLCGAVSFNVKNEFSSFYQCHCRQCQQLTGSAFAANLFTKPDNIAWLKGIESITHFHHCDRSFSKSFCQNCGSALPFVTKSAKWLIVPAGSLNEAPAIKLQANIFCKEKAWWIETENKAKDYDSAIE